MRCRFEGSSSILLASPLGFARWGDSAETLQDIARSYNVSHPRIVWLFPSLSAKAANAAA
jgi:hypothetical protein